MNTDTEEGDLLLLKERYYKRNYMAFMLEAFFFSFTAAIFSYITVLPGYVSTLTDNAFLISLISILYMAGNYGMQLFSCVLSVNARRQKPLYLFFSFGNRITLFLITLSTFANASSPAALTLFFLAYGMNTTFNGLCVTACTSMIGEVIHRNRGSFFGSYSLCNSLFGLIAAQVMTFILARFGAPMNYRLLFLIGAVGGLCATLCLTIFVKEVPRPPAEKIRFSSLPAQVKQILTAGGSYRRFLFIRAASEAALMASPFFVIYLSAQKGIGPAFIGFSATVLLLAQAVGAKLWGFAVDRIGTFRVSCCCAALLALAPLTALLAKGEVLACLSIAFMGLGMSGIYLCSSVSTLKYALPGKTGIFSAITGLLIFPVSLFFNALAGLLARLYSVRLVFWFAMACALFTCLLALYGAKKEKSA